MGSNVTHICGTILPCKVGKVLYQTSIKFRSNNHLSVVKERSKSKLRKGSCRVHVGESDSVFCGVLCTLIFI